MIRNVDVVDLGTTLVPRSELGYRSLGSSSRCIVLNSLRLRAPLNSANPLAAWSAYQMDESAPNSGCCGSRHGCRR
eukprot:717757-Amphidinium_carterae.1